MARQPCKPPRLTSALRPAGRCRVPLAGCRRTLGGECPWPGL